MADKDFIENIFQRATEEFDLEFNPEAWERMEKKLDQKRRKRLIILWFSRVGFALLSLFIIGFLWYKLTAPAAKPQPKESELPIVTAPSATEELCPDDEVIEQKLSPTFQKSKNRDQVIAKDNNNKSVYNNPDLIISKLHRQPQNQQIDNNIALEEKISKTDAQLIDYQNKTLEDFKESHSTFELNGIAQVEIPQLKSLTSNESIIISQASVDSSHVIRTKKLQQHPWTLGLFGAPESASVGFNDPSRKGYSFGFLIEYQFAKRFSVNAQGMYAKKHYIAGKGDFYRAGGWPYQISPIETTGDCNILGSTITLRSELLQKPKWNLIANTGIATWWMLREEYYYKYDRHYPGLIYEWESNETLAHWWAIAQAGLGVEAKLTSKLSIQADLFMQIPLQGVGHGKVELYSKGLALSLRRRL
ncbi:MAG: hypothetical protein SFU99_04415 [Saprospiraceae bacterium]|nr:hypothetical protein [Saprospiraceae bacterium]